MDPHPVREELLEGAGFPLQQLSLEQSVLGENGVVKNIH